MIDRDVPLTAVAHGVTLLVHNIGANVVEVGDDHHDHDCNSQRYRRDQPPIAAPVGQALPRFKEERRAHAEDEAEEKHVEQRHHVSDGVS